MPPRDSCDACALSVLLALVACGNTAVNSSYNFGPGDAGDATLALPDVRRLAYLGDASDGPPALTPPCAAPSTGMVTGTIYDPSGRNPIYDVAVYIPGTALTELPRGVLTGAQACSCSALYPSAAYASTSTGVDGSFTLQNVPVGAQNLVFQLGKWRRQVPINVVCGTNSIPDRTLKFPSSISAGDTIDSMADIAVSTGGADSLECMLLRVGIDASEYVAGASMTGHVHVFSGGTGTEPAMLTSPIVGFTEETPMPGAPESSVSLWSTQAQLMPYDVVLLSCEGGETWNANPPALEAYLNAGGRVFASHYHYAWFSGLLLTTQSYTAPLDWGDNLGEWEKATMASSDTLIGGVLDLTLNNGSGKPFSKGATMQAWLAKVGALGMNAAADELSIFSPRYNVVVTPSDIHSQPWLTADETSSQPGATMYFSFDTPLEAGAPSDASAPAYCGRAVFSDLHVGSDPSIHDTSPPPGGCDHVDLSPQEKALEFMLFDLSSCVTDDALPVPDAGTIVIPPLH